MGILHQNPALDRHLDDLERGDAVILEDRQEAKELEVHWRECHPGRPFDLQIKSIADRLLMWISA